MALCIRIIAKSVNNIADLMVSCALDVEIAIDCYSVIHDGTTINGDQAF